MKIETNRFILREWRLSDSHSLAKHANNIKVARNLTDMFPNPYTEQDAINFITMNAAFPKQFNFAIEINGEAVGGIGIAPKGDVYKITAEIGYWLAEEYWGQGIVTESVKEIVKYAFDNFELVKLFAGVFEYNLPSMRVLEKAGFTKEAILKKGAIKNNVVIDLHYYVLFKGEQ